MSSILIIDMGSNAMKAVLVAPGSDEILWKERIETRMGARVVDGVLPDADVEWLLEQTRELVDRVQDFAGERELIPVLTQCFATGIFRGVGNREEILARFGAIPCFRMKIISEETEARLERLGIETSPIMKENAGKCFLSVDFGGGSTEFSLFIPGNEPLASRSIPIGQHTVTAAKAAGERDVIERSYGIIEDFLKIRQPDFILAAGSAVTGYARYVLGDGDVWEGSVESCQVHGGALVPEVDRAACLGREVILALEKYVDAPVYVTTKGLRHGVIRTFNEF